MSKGQFPAVFPDDRLAQCRAPPWSSCRGYSKPKSVLVEIDNGANTPSVHPSHRSATSAVSFALHISLICSAKASNADTTQSSRSCAARPTKARRRYPRPVGIGGFQWPLWRSARSRPGLPCRGSRLVTPMSASAFMPASSSRSSCWMV